MTKASNMTNTGSIRAKLKAIAFLLALMMLAGVFAVGPQLRGAILATEISSMRLQLANFDRRLSKAVKETAGKSNVSSINQIGNVFVTGDTAGIAGAELQSRLAKHVRRHGGVVKALLVLPARSSRKSNIATVKVTANISIKGLRAIIYEIETSTPLLFIDNIVVTVAKAHGLRRTVRGPVRLDVELQVSGFRKGRPTS